MQKIIAAIIMIAALAVAGTAGAETWVLGETRPGLGQFSIGDTVTDPETGTTLVIPADAQIFCHFRGEHNVIRIIDKKTASDALSLAYLAEYQRVVAGQPQLYARLDDPETYLVYRSVTTNGTTTGQFILVVTGANYGGAVVNLDDPNVVRAFSSTNVQVQGTVYGTPSAWTPRFHAAVPEALNLTYLEADQEWPEEEWWVVFNINLDGADGYCQADWISPTDPTADPPPATDCTGATTDLERGTCTGRETMTSEARTGIIIGLGVY